MKMIGFRPMLLVDKFDECFRFYRDMMGLTVAWGEEGGNYATFLVDGINKLSIFDSKSMANVIGNDDLPNEPVSKDRFAIIFGVDDISTTMSELRKNGVEFVTPLMIKHDWGIQTIFLRDPDGTLLQIESDMPRDEWTDELKSDMRKYDRGD